MATKVQRRSHKSKSSKSSKRVHRNKKTKKSSRSKKHLKNMRGGGSITFKEFTRRDMLNAIQTKTIPTDIFWLSSDLTGNPFGFYGTIINIVLQTDTQDKSEYEIEVKNLNGKIYYFSEIDLKFYIPTIKSNESNVSNEFSD